MPAQVKTVFCPGKGGFFQRVRFVFQIFQSPKKIIPNYYTELEIQTRCLLLWAETLNFKFMTVIENILFLEFGRFEKQITLSA